MNRFELGEGDNAVVEAFFDFDVDYGKGVLVVHAVPADASGGTLKARSTFTRLEQLNSATDVVVVGAGQSGLVTAAFLRRLGVDVLNVDRYENVGDSWGKRYKSLTLHNQIEMNGFPFLDFPPHYPEYLAKDTLGEWLNLYRRPPRNSGRKPAYEAG